MGGPDLIDVKEPLRGSLGQVAGSVIAEIAAAVGDRLPVSAALGELLEVGASPPAVNLAYAKWGLSGCLHHPGWPQELARRATEVRAANPRCQLVGVAYADWKRAQAPDPYSVCRAAAAMNCAVVLVDTFEKDGSSLLTWLSENELREVRRRTRQMGLQLALAGGVDFELLPTALEIEPDWIAVRGAVCDGGRAGALCPNRVARMAKAIRGRAIAEGKPPGFVNCMASQSLP
jgi:uncharacterized protein (UPF0264 family)